MDSRNGLNHCFWTNEIRTALGIGVCSRRHQGRYVSIRLDIHDVMLTHVARLENLNIRFPSFSATISDGAILVARPCGPLRIAISHSAGSHLIVSVPVGSGSLAGSRRRRRWWGFTTQ